VIVCNNDLLGFCSSIRWRKQVICAESRSYAEAKNWIDRLSLFFKWQTKFDVYWWVCESCIEKLLYPLHIISLRVVSWQNRDFDGEEKMYYLVLILCNLVTKEEETNLVEEKDILSSFQRSLISLKSDLAAETLCLLALETVERKFCLAFYLMGVKSARNSCAWYIHSLDIMLILHHLSIFGFLTFLNR